MVDVATIGETMAAIRTIGQIRLGGQAQWSIAGSESTVAIGIARLGHSSRWIGRLGADQPGDLILRTLRAENVDTSYVQRDESRPTGLILFESRIPDRTTVSYYRAGSAGSDLSPLEIPEVLPVDTRVLHVTGISPALGSSAAAVIHSAMSYAKQCGITVCFDVNYRSRLWRWQAAAEALSKLVEQADIVVASADELSLVAPHDPPALNAQAEALFAGGVSEVVITDGSAGATAMTRDLNASIPARKVSVVDSVGAGDAFVAGYLSGWLDGVDVDERLDRGSMAAAFSVATSGDWEGLPTRDDLALLKAPEGTTFR